MTHAPRRPWVTLCTLALALCAPGGQPARTTPADWPAAAPSPARVSSTPASDLGFLLLETPESAPGGAPRAPTPSLERIRAHLEADDTDRALRDAERLVQEGRWGRERTLASFVAGLIYREKGLHNLASESFTRVRVSRTPLAEWATYYEAEQDRLRGKPWTAVRECESYRKKYEKGRFDAACQRLMARALVEAGRTGRAREVADAHDAEFEDDPIREQIDLAIAKRWTDLYPELAKPLLRKLVVEHAATLTGRVAEQLLAELRQAGHEDAVIPDDTASLQRRAVSLRDVKRKDEAWDLYQELVRRSADDPRLAAWVEDNAARFAWRTHRWDALAELSRARFAESGDEDDLWQLYKALDRGGRAKEALKVALQGQRDFGRTRRWRRTEEIIGRTALLAGDYAEAVRQLDTRARRGGWGGRRAQWVAGFASFMAEDHEGAIERFDAVIERDRGYVPNARYWRSRAHDAIGQTELAEADRAWLLTEAPLDWYALLVRLQNGDDTRQGPPWDRTGRWVHPPEPVLPEVRVDRRHTDALPLARPASGHPSPGASRLATLTWPLRTATEPVLSPVSPPTDVFRSPVLPPESYRPSPLWDRDEGWRDLDRIARRVGDDWPEWEVARDLADVGLYDLSGPIMSEIYEEWRKAWRNPRHARHTVARRIPSRGTIWRGMFYVTRDHHHADRFTYGLWDEVEDPELRPEAYRLGWPLAHDHAVWRHARAEDVDPLLVMGLMRIESRYNSIAVSRVGARGAMQIMPRTGRLLADLKGDEDFLTGDLEDPVFAVGYGIFYLGKLLDRFGGNAPLAVASYNGGPFNVSAWLKGAGHLPMDQLVEHIPYRETRGYVRKVTAAYAHYLDLYADPGTRIVLPEPPYSDDPSVVDF